MIAIQSQHRDVVAALDRMSGAVVLGASLVAGVGWGLFARLWMRFITTDPEFSWVGSLFVTVGFGVAVVGQAGVYLGRRGGLGLRYVVALRAAALIALLPMGFGAGGFAFPVLVFAPLAAVRQRWSRWIRLGLAVMSLAVGVFISTTFFADLSVVRALIGTLWFAVVYAGLVWTVCFSFASRHDPRFGAIEPNKTDPRAARR